MNSFVGTSRAFRVRICYHHSCRIVRVQWRKWPGYQLCTT